MPGGAMDLEAFREQLVVWGITPNVLMFIGIISIVTLFFSVRVVVKWYFGIHAIQDDLRTMKKQLSDIQVLLSMPQNPQTVLTDDFEKEEAASTKPKAAKSDSFRLTNH